MSRKYLQKDSVHIIRIFFNLMASGLQVGKGLSKDENARELAIQHWLEAVSPYQFPSLDRHSVILD
jgi:hypothetical protein